jgi:hypothetical protein
MGWLVLGLRPADARDGLAGVFAHRRLTKRSRERLSLLKTPLRTFRIPIKAKTPPLQRFGLDV